MNVIKTSSVVNSWSLIAKQDGSSKDMEVTEPRISRGLLDQMKSAADETFLTIDSPSSYL